MKKVFISVLEYCGIAFSKEEIESADSIQISEENLAVINTKLEEAKGLQALLDASASDLTAATDTLEAVTAERDKALIESEASDNKIEELETEVSRLGSLSGSTKTEVEKAEADRNAISIGAYADPSVELYSYLN
jgi:chromosome segregation ATPase